MKGIMKRMILRSLGLCVFLMTMFFSSRILYAQDISFDASVSANKVALGAPLRLTLTVHGTQDVQAVSLPAIEGFESRYIGPSSQVSVINNAYSAKKSFNYQLVPVKEGKWVIPPVEIQIKGAAYRTETVLIEVGPAGTSIEGAQNAEGDISKKIRMVMVTPRRDVFWHEMVPVVIKLYVGDVDLRDISYPALSGDGFEALGFAQPKRYQERVDGVSFQVIEFSTGIVPMKDGELSLGPAMLEGAIPVKADEMDDQTGIFGDSFFNGFFGSSQKQVVRVTAQPVVLNVKPLPEAGRPSFFSGAIGVFDVSTEVSPKEVKVGDPVTVRMEVKGTGGLKNAQFAVYKPDGFKAYDPQVKNEDGVLIFEQVIIPSAATVKEVPALSFNYFDPLKGEYQTVSQGPFPLKVEDLPPEQEFKAVGFSAQGAAVEENFGRDIVFIKDHPGRLHRKESFWCGPWPFLLAILLYLNIWGGLFAFRRHQIRLESDDAFARRMKAPREARARIKELTVGAGNTKASAGECRRILGAFLADVFDLAPGGISIDEVKAFLSDRQVSLQTLDRIVKIMTLCDAVCFASVSLSNEESLQMIADLQDVINDIERRCL